MADVGQAVQRAKDKTLDMQARADAINELTEAGALDDFTSSGDAIDRQLAQISQSGQVDDELAKLKAELGQGDAPKEVEAPADDAPRPKRRRRDAGCRRTAKPAPRSRAKKTT